MHRKFVTSAVLLSQCDPGFRHALGLLVQSVDGAESFDDLVSKANDPSYLSLLQSGLIPQDQLIDHLLNLLPFLKNSADFDCSGKTNSPLSPLNNDESVKETEVFMQSDNSAKEQFHKEKEAVPDEQQQQQQREQVSAIKKQYLSLIAECTCQHSAFTRLHDQIPSNDIYSIAADKLSELVVQLPVGQLLIRSLLHPIFNAEDRSWLLSVLHTHQKSVEIDSAPDKESQPASWYDDLCAHSNNMLCAKSLDCLLEIASDLVLVLQSLNSGSERFASSMSRSLTSSGFSSGCGGSESQYDLLSDANGGAFVQASNTSGSGSQYGTLLTVPSTDLRNASLNPAQSENRQQSDISYLPSCSGVGSGVPQPGRTQPHGCRPTSSVTRSPYASFECALNSASQQPMQQQHYQQQSQPHHLTFLHAAKQAPNSRCSLPNALSSQYPAVVVIKQTDDSVVGGGGDSVSLSSASSTFSSSLDLGITCPHRHIGFPNTSAETNSAAKHENACSLPPSPPAALQQSSDTCRHQASTNVRGILQTSLSLPAAECGTTGTTETNAVQQQNLSSGAGCSIVPTTYLHPPGSSTDDSPATSHDSSPESHVCNALPTSDPGSTAPFSSPDVGMAAVPIWLKSLRLHKYSGLFQNLTYDEFMNITESWLEERHVTQGARTKLLLSIRKLSTRTSNLARTEALLVHGPSFGPGATSVIHDCLSEIWSVLQTPIKPCSFIRKMSQSSVTDPVTGEIEQKPGGDQKSTHSASVESSVQADNSVAGDHNLSAFSTTNKSEDRPDEASRALVITDKLADHPNCIPGRIMGCLTKVCSRLLVSSQPDPDCCDKFIQILDVIMGHPAFMDKQKSLAASWRQQMFAIRDTLPFHVLGELNRPSRSVPRSYHGSRQVRKHPFGMPTRYHYSQRKVPDTQRDLSINALNHPINEVSYHSPKHTPTDMRTGLNVRPHLPPKSGPLDNTIQPTDENGSRRHSVPVNQAQMGPSPIKSCQGRRMPSPNPTFMSNRRGPISPSNNVFFPGPTQSSSDIDVSLLTPHATRNRFPSPSGFDPVCSRRSLIPPATAPPTRMPSPSDPRRQDPYDPHSQYFTAPIGFPPRLPCPYSSSTSRLVVDDPVRLRNGHSPATSSIQAPIGTNLPVSYGCISETSHQHPSLRFSHDLADSASPSCGYSFVQRGPCESCRRSMEVSNTPGAFSFESSSIPAAAPFSFASTSGQFFSGFATNLQAEDRCESAVGPYSLLTSEADPTFNRGFCRQGPFIPSELMRERQLSGAAALTSSFPGFEQHQRRQSTIPSGQSPGCTDQLDVGGWPILPRANFGQMCVHPVSTNLSANPPSVSSDMGADFIEHDLDLLTRKVTELAIGEFDSPVD
ncbi:unnamed protein product [Calicophoron daubneyi]